MLRVLRAEGGRVEAGGRELVRPGGKVWVDCDGTPENLAFLGEAFGFHPLALEDAATEDQRPKFEQYPDTDFLVVHRLALAPDDSDVLALEIDAFLTAGALVTVHTSRIPELDRVFERCGEDPALLGRGADFALYLLLDALVDVHYALVESLTQDVDALADHASGPGADHDPDAALERVVEARRAHARARRRLAPQREVFLALARPGQGIVDERTALYFRDVADHTVRLTDEVDAGRDLLSSLMDVLLSRTNNRLSAVTARLTLIATIFLPLNFIAGFFGMNLQVVEPRLAVPVVLAAMVILPVVMVVWFRRKRWL